MSGCLRYLACVLLCDQELLGKFGETCSVRTGHFDVRPLVVQLRLRVLHHLAACVVAPANRMRQLIVVCVEHLPQQKAAHPSSVTRSSKMRNAAGTSSARSAFALAWLAIPSLRFRQLHADVLLRFLLQFPKPVRAKSHSYSDEPLLLIEIRTLIPLNKFQAE